MTTTNNLRELYFANKIFRIGDIVEDSSTGDELKIIDRGSNYITVANSAGTTMKKWLNEVVVTKSLDETEAEPTTEFGINESGQIVTYGYITTNFYQELSEDVLDIFEDFEDLYCKRQIIQNLDLAINENGLDRQYELVERVAALFAKNDIEEPFIIESLKDHIERKRIVQIIATVADVKMTDSLSDTMKKCIDALRKKYTERKQWAVLYPFLKIAKSTGISNATLNLPFNITHVDDEPSKDETLSECITELMEFSLDEFELTLEDIADAFPEEDNSEYINEVLSLQGRAMLGRKMRARETQLNVKRERSLHTTANSATIMARARHLALTMMKRKMFRKPTADMTRQEKERFESGASRRKAVVARLAQKLVSRVRAMQSARMHAVHPTQQHSTTVSGAD